MPTLWRQKIDRGIYAVETEEKRGRSTRRRIRLVIRREGTSSSETVSSREEAIRLGRQVAAELEKRRLMACCLVAYREHLQRKGLKQSSITKTMRSLEALVGETEMVEDLSPRLCQSLYESVAERYSTTTALNIMGQARTWGRWMVKRGMFASNPWETVETYGTRRRGKPQLTGAECRKLVVQCLEHGGWEGGAVLCALLLGLRASEVATISERDIDGGVLWVRGTKTVNAARRVEVPDMLQALLADVARVTLTRYQVTGACKRLCKAAGVPELSAQCLRATHATLARSAGATSELVAAQLGHGSTHVTEQHYIAPGTSANADMRKVLRVMNGGAE